MTPILIIKKGMSLTFHRNVSTVEQLVLETWGLIRIYNMYLITIVVSKYSSKL